MAQGLEEDINAMHASGRSSAPIGQGLVYDINTLHAFWLRESQRTYGSVSAPVAQGLVEIINAKGKKNGDVSKNPRTCEKKIRVLG